MIDHTGCVVSDWAKSKAFYDAALGADRATLVMMVPPEGIPEASRSAAMAVRSRILAA